MSHFVKLYFQSEFKTIATSNHESQLTVDEYDWNSKSLSDLLDYRIFSLKIVNDYYTKHNYIDEIGNSVKLISVKSISSLRSE